MVAWSWISSRWKKTMPFTPFHFGPGAALHALAPRHVSFLGFCGANVLVDVEPLYYMLTGQYPIHRLLHTYAGVSLVIGGTVLVFLLLRRIGRRFGLPNPFGWQRLPVHAVLLGAALGGFTHVALDSVMHSDIQPLAPFSTANALYLSLDTDDLHWWCVAAGVAGLLILGFRRSAG